MARINKLDVPVHRLILHKFNNTDNRTKQLGLIVLGDINNGERGCGKCTLNPVDSCDDYLECDDDERKDKQITISIPIRRYSKK